MTSPSSGDQPPTRVRLIIATVVALLTVLCVWRVVDYRSQPPPPLHPVGAPAAIASPPTVPISLEAIPVRLSAGSLQLAG